MQNQNIALAGALSTNRVDNIICTCVSGIPIFVVDVHVVVVVANTFGAATGRHVKLYVNLAINLFPG